MALITAARAQQNTFLASLTSASLSNLIDAASNLIEGYCDRVFTAADYTESLDGNMLDWIYIKNPPINSLTQAIITDSAGTTYTIESTDLDYDSVSGRVVFAEDNSASYSFWPKGYNNCRIDYNGGWSTIPADVQEACVQTVLMMAGPNKDSGNPAMQSERLGDYQYSRASKLMANVGDSGLPMNVEAMLARYVIRRAW